MHQLERWRVRIRWKGKKEADGYVAERLGSRREKDVGNALEGEEIDCFEIIGQLVLTLIVRKCTHPFQQPAISPTNPLLKDS